MEDNLGALDLNLTAAQVDRLNQISKFSKPFPHSFIELDMYRRVLDGDTQIEAGFSVYQ